MSKRARREKKREIERRRARVRAILFSKKARILALSVLGAALVALIVLLSVFLPLYSDVAVVMEVNGLPVTREEFQFHMKMVKKQVESYFWLEHIANSSEIGFWEGTFGEERENPLALLRETAQESAIRSKALQSLAIQYGITTNVDFGRIRGTMEEVNVRRRAAFEAGEVLYGPVEFEFLSYWLEMESNFESQLEDKMKEQGAIAVTDEEVRARYEWYYHEFHNDNSFTASELHIPYLPVGMEKNEDVELTVDEAYEQIVEVYNLLIGGADFEGICEQYTRDIPYEFTMDWEAAFTGSKAEIIRRASSLAEGEYSEPYENGFGFSILKMVQTRVAVDIDLEEAYSALYSAQMSENYRAYLDNRTQEAEVTVHSLVYNRVGL